MKIGIIADTHGLLRPQALAALQGVDQLIHAGDIGGPQILAELERIAPLSVVRGNNDGDAWAEGIPERLTLRFGTVSLVRAARYQAVGYRPQGRRHRRGDRRALAQAAA